MSKDKTDKTGASFNLSNLGEVISKGVQAGVRGMNAGFLGMKQGLDQAERGIDEGMSGMREGLSEAERGIRHGARGMEEGMKNKDIPDDDNDDEDEDDCYDDEKRSSKALKWFGIEREGGIHLNLDLGKIVIGSISLALGIASFFLYLIPFVLVLSWPIAAAGFVCGLIPIFSFGQGGWFRGFTFGIIGAALSGGTLFFHIYDLATAQTSLDYLLGFWGA
ncbi:hypothetical protein K8R78_00415 [bacterium]|nr:hypothetical protein [bacterium]